MAPKNKRSGRITTPKVKVRPKKSARKRKVAREPTKSYGTGFFDLSAELRNQIYSMVIDSHDSNKQPDFLAICRQVRSEALQLFCATYTFTFQCTTAGVDVFDWTRAAGDANITHVRHVSFTGAGRDKGALILDLSNGLTRTTVLRFWLKHGQTEGRENAPRGMSVALDRHLQSKTRGSAERRLRSVASSAHELITGRRWYMLE